MRIKEIILEGFKSYHDRTVLSMLDPQFNAITGLNGSGKSNILDAICFALGLQTVKLARVETLRELIYKNGQGGIKSATVTLIFSNKDPDRSPINFEPGKDIIVCRTIKTDTSEYRVNGQRHTTGQVKTLFKSIGLDIENYQTFFVQQGRIMSIVNFQPRELMSFVEEAANVNYYNSVKVSATDQISKNETKVNIIDRKVEVDLPEKLRKAQEEYIEFQRLQEVGARLAEATTRVYAYQRKLNREEEENIRQNITKLKGLQESLGAEKNVFRRSANDFKSLISRLEVQIQAESIPSEREQAIKEFDAKRRALEAKGRERKILEGEVETQKAKLVQLEGNLEREKVAIQNVELEKASFADSVQKFSAQYDKIRVALMADPNASEKLMKSEFEAAKAELTECEAKLAEAKRQLERGKTELAEALEKRIRNESLTTEFRQKIDRLAREREGVEHEAQELEKKCLNEPNLKSRLNDLTDKWREATARAQALQKASPNRFGLTLDPKTPPEIRAKIHGRLHQLIEFPDEAHFLSLEVASEGKLNFVVVEDSDTIAEILEKKYIQEKTRFMALNKLMYSTLNPNQLAKAQQVAQKRRMALFNPMELIRCDKKYQRAAEFVFGNRLIVSDLDLANAIAFDPEIGKVVVTTDGDKVVPSGALEGGYFDPRNLLIPKAREFRAVTEELRSLEQERVAVEDESNRILLVKDRLAKMRAQAKSLEKEEESVMESLAKFGVEGINRQINSGTTRVGQLEFEVKQLESTRLERQQKIQKWSGQVGKSKKGDNKKFMEEELEHSKKEQARFEALEKRAVADLTKRQVAYQSLKEDLENLKRDLDQGKDKARRARGEEDDLRRQVEVLGEVVKENEEKFNEVMKKKASWELQKAELEQQAAEAESNFEQRNRQLAETVDEVGKLERELQSLLKEKDALQKHKLAREHTEEVEPEMSLAQLLRSLESAKAEIAELRKEFDRLSKRVDKNAELNFAQLSAKISQVTQYKEQIHTDKAVMLTTISELDVKRDDAIEMCFRAVNKTLGQIFGSLLPGAFAEMSLEPIVDRKGVPGKKGVKIRISLGGKWKDSLTELSGGQRSLLALSFLLALLKYRPAPFYILDEVDSALDLSHTENLGGLLSLQFPQSQFIAISLKEEFYSHANVLFKTSLVQGYSVVDRLQINKGRH